MLKTQIYLEITENMSIFDVGELQNLRFTNGRKKSDYFEEWIAPMSFI